MGKKSKYPVVCDFNNASGGHLLVDSGCGHAEEGFDSLELGVGMQRVG
jgi:hypothetical protein